MTTTAFDSPLSQDVLNIDRKSRSSLFPWRGQFSPEFVESLLRAYAKPNSVVLDPFMGSGTVLVESARRGHRVHGLEVNPAAYLIARTHELANAGASRRKEIVEAAENVLRVSLPGPPGLFRNTEHQVTGPQRGLLEQTLASSHGVVRNLLEALIVLVDKDPMNPDPDSVWAKWNQLKQVVTSLPYSRRKVTAHLGDARRVPLVDNSVDFVLSSPPYINVFNYHHNYRSAVEGLGWKPLVVARSEIGANRKFRQNRFLTVIQYCIDIALVLSELHRVGSERCRIVLVVGRESNVHKTPFYNGEIVKRLATELAGCDVVCRQERVFTNRYGQHIYEDVFHLLKQRKIKDNLVEIAREIGVAALREAHNRVPVERKHYLDDAITRGIQVDPSPVAEMSMAMVEGAHHESA